MSPLTPIMRAVLVAVQEIENEDRSAAKRRGARTFVWLGATPQDVTQRVTRALNQRLAINGPVAALTKRGLLMRAPVYDRATTRTTTRYMLTPAGRTTSRSRREHRGRKPYGVRAPKKPSDPYEP